MSDDLESLLASAETHGTTDVALARRLLRHAVSTARTQTDDRVLPHCLHRAAVLLLRWHDACGAYARCIEGQPLLARHRLVYDALGTLMQTDIHALSLKALAPSES